MAFQVMTDLRAYNVAKSESGKFIIVIDSEPAKVLPFDRYIDAFNKAQKMNSNYGTNVAPKIKKLFKTNSRGMTKAAPTTLRTLSG